MKGKGSFSLQEDRFVFTGKAEAEHFAVNDFWLRKSVSFDKVGADVMLSASGDIIDVRIEKTRATGKPLCDCHSF